MYVGGFLRMQNTKNRQRYNRMASQLVPKPKERVRQISKPKTNYDRNKEQGSQQAQQANKSRSRDAMAPAPKPQK